MNIELTKNKMNQIFKYIDKGMEDIYQSQIDLTNANAFIETVIRIEDVEIGWVKYENKVFKICVLYPDDVILITSAKLSMKILCIKNLKRLINQVEENVNKYYDLIE